MSFASRFTFFLALLITAAAPQTTQAQAKVATPTAATVAAPPAESSAVPTPTPAADPSTVPAETPKAAEPSDSPLLAGPMAGSCFPGCRKGFVCKVDQCVSICNPVCGPGEMCTESLECVEMPKAVDPNLGPPPNVGAEMHDGFYLRLSAGLGFAGSERTIGVGSNKYKYSYGGGAGFFSVDLGAAIAEDFIVFGRVGGFGIGEPTVERNGENLGTAKDEMLTFSMLGVGAAYYFMPYGLHVDVALGASQASTQVDGNNTSRSKLGVGFDLEFGKEWWVSEQWGLGVALRVSLSNVPPSDGASKSDTHLESAALGLLFTATYN